MRGKTAVFVYAADPLSAAGAKAQLMNEPTIELVGPIDIDRARVALLVADSPDASVGKVVKALQRDGVPRVLLVAGRFDEAGVVAATAAGVTGFLRRSEATTARLVAAIHEADESGCCLPDGLLKKAALVRHQDGQLDTIDLTDGNPDPWGHLLNGGLHPAGSGSHQLSDREAEVLRLVAEGYDTSDVATHLGFSESTIKGILAKVMTRIDARNRCHAVAIVTKNGLI